MACFEKRCTHVQPRRCNSCDQLWDPGQPSPLGRDTFRDLLEGSMMAVQDLEFLTIDECRKIEAEHARITALTPQIAAAYGFAVDVTYTGPPLHDFESRPDEYFALAALASRMRAEHGPMWQSAVERVIARLATLHDGEIRRAVQRDRGEVLFTGLLRNINHAAYAHTDFVPETLKGNWDVKHEVVDQYGLNLYVTQCTGGDCTIYDRREQVGDDAWRPVGSNYGVTEELFDEVPRVIVPPTQGSFAVINTRRYHRIDPISSGSRMTLSMFLGLTRDGSLLVWA